MRIFVVSICSLALAYAAGAQALAEKNEQPKKKGAQTGEVSKQPGKPVGKPTTTGKPTTAAKPAEVGKPSGAKSTATKEQTHGIAIPPYKEGKKPTTTTKAAEAGKPAEVGKATGADKEKATAAAGKPIKPQHFDLPKQPNTAKAPPVTFQQGRRVEGSQNWQGQQYAAFRNYQSEWHDQG